MPSPEVEAFYRLPAAELHEKLRALHLHCQAAGPELAAFSTGLFGHLLGLSGDTFGFVADMEQEIQGLPQNHAGKRLLLGDIRRMPFVGPLTEEKIRDRIGKALLQRPPEPEKKKARKAVVQGGREFVFPDGLAPDE